jgi:hypothetical protein
MKSLTPKAKVVAPRPDALLNRSHRLTFGEGKDVQASGPETHTEGLPFLRQGGSQETPKTVSLFRINNMSL